MSANLLAGVKPILALGSMSDGVITSSTPKDKWCDVAFWPITTDTLAENQTMHIGISAKWHGEAATTGAAWASVKYADTAGNTNSVNTHIDGITTEWKRFSLSAVVPSGMRIVDFHISGANLDAAYDATSPVLSYGSPTVLSQAEAALSRLAAISLVTRYYQLLPSGSSAPSVPASSSDLGSWTASEPSADTAKDLWQCECTKLDDGTETWSAATKSSAYEAAKSVSADVTKLSDRLSANVSEQTKWNDSYSSRTSSLEQTAAGFSASLDSMSSTDASIHQWMSFGQGTDGKPTLTIGTSDSDIVSKQTNSGLSYQTRGGTELMSLDAASRSAVMPHMHADDASMGNWQLGPTQGGTHFTLMYIGG